MTLRKPSPRKREDDAPSGWVVAADRPYPSLAAEELLMSRNGFAMRTTAAIVCALAAGYASSAIAATATEINTAIGKGLGYLSSTQAAGGYWNYGGYEPAATGAAAYAMLSQQSQWGANAAVYQAQVDKAMTYLLANATKQVVSTRNDGANICPGGSGSCAGVYWQAAGNENTYTTGLIAPAIALYAKSNPSAVATASGPLAGMTWGQIAQGITNSYSASQSTANQGVNLRGGWRYYDGLPYYDSDMSTTQWAAVSMVYDQSLGASTPSIVKTDLPNFLAFTQSPSGAGCYQGPGSGICDHSDTGGLLLSLSFLGKTSADPAEQAALGFLNAHWGEGANSTWAGNFGHPYAMWSVYKGLETSIGLSDTTHITNLVGCGALDAGVTCNWWQDYNNWLVGNQQASGGWGGYAYWTDPLATSFYLPILAGTQIPTPPIPEPETYALMLAGLATLASIARRRRQAA
ncbi:MAG: PEP-CTERM sorting domain-containing protein [Caldimonas sp.]